MNRVVGMPDRVAASGSKGGAESTPDEQGDVSALMAGLVGTGGEGILAAAARHHLGSRGKLLRARLALTAGRALAVSSSERVAVAAACELVHNASLVHDDLQDGDRHRRGDEAVWSRFGEGVAVCLGDHLLSAGFRALARVGADSTPLVERLGERVAELSSGQAEELALCRAGQAADWPAYERIAGLKTAPLLSLPLELILLRAGSEDCYARATADLARAFGIAYQIHDDLEDLYVDYQPASELPAVHAVRALRGGAGEAEAAREAGQRGRGHLQEAERWLRGLPGELAAELEGQLERLRQGLG